jgi:hypothetical protein
MCCYNAIREIACNLCRRLLVSRLHEPVVGNLKYAGARAAGMRATRQELGRGCGNALDCARDSADGELSALAMAAERETWDDLVAILSIQLASLLEPLFWEK